MKGTVKDVMTREPKALKKGDTCRDAAALMRKEDCGSLPIVEGDRLVGIVTDRDIVIRAIAADKDPRTCAVGDVMTADPVTVSPRTSLDEAATIMAERQIRRLPVIDGGRLVGILVIGQLARRESAQVAGETLKEVSEPA